MININLQYYLIHIFMHLNLEYDLEQNFLIENKNLLLKQILIKKFKN